ncbi:MAG: ABC transporter ATP-binding protein [Chloroflexales bacterium]|nr:ABC transporter ATP-binding protein [Chloroflexales bacterium]
MLAITDAPPSLSTPTAPSTPSPAISVRGVGKMHRIYDRPQDRLKQMLWRGRRNYGQEFWALRDVSFEVGKGETVGIIGRNGSGKSTLLQIIAGTMAPTEGEVLVNGRVAALLELGSGFNPEFTGSENVFLNGAILGIERAEMERRFDDIAAFADIGQFIDQPVKTYSSGMYARLAFAIGIHVDPEIFIIDETLSVGDVFFQSRCVRKLDEYRAAGGTALFVTHDSYTLERICTHSIVLHHGRKIFDGNNADAVNLYYRIERGVEPDAEGATPGEASAAIVELRRDQVTGDGAAFIEEISITNSVGKPSTTFHVNDWMIVQIRARFLSDLDGFDFGVGLRDHTGVLLGGAHTFYRQQSRGPVQAGHEEYLTARIKLALVPGTFLLLAGIARNVSTQEWLDHYVLWDCCAITVIGQPTFWGQMAIEHSLT